MTVTKGTDEVIVKTIPEKKLPDTGGLPIGALLGLGVFVAAASILLRGT